MQAIRNNSFGIIAGFFLMLLAGCGGESPTTTTAPVLSDESIDAGSSVVLQTNMGDIGIALDAAKAPASVANFLQYVENGHYDGTVFHRVIAGFMIQGGGFDEALEQKTTLDPIANEATNGLKNVTYTVAMARTSDVNSATSQFFINVADNAFLDHRDTTVSGFGYAVFGKVVAGTEVVDQIAATQTGAAGRFTKDVPVEAVVIQSVVVK